MRHRDAAGGVIRSITGRYRLSTGYWQLPGLVGPSRVLTILGIDLDLVADLDVGGRLE